MVTLAELRELSAARMRDAQVLFDSGRYDAASHLCGYALELALKAKMCQTLGWSDFPTGSEYRSLRTHNLGVLLHLSGVEDIVMANLEKDWKTVNDWTSEVWYLPVGSRTREDASAKLLSTQRILGAL